MPKLGLRHENVNFTNKVSPKMVCFNGTLVSVWRFLFLDLPLIDEETWCGRWLVEKPLTLACSDILFVFWKMHFFLKIWFSLPFCHAIGPGIDSQLDSNFFSLFFSFDHMPTSKVIWGQASVALVASSSLTGFSSFTRSALLNVKVKYIIIFWPPVTS